VQYDHNLVVASAEYGDDRHLHADSHAVMPMHTKATRLAARSLACCAFQVPDAAASILALVREEHCGIDSSDGVTLPAKGSGARRTRYQ
jgi:hypothetical protein